jgi:hypothetical protein
MDAARYSKNSVNFYQNTLGQVPEDSTLRSVGLSSKLLPAFVSTVLLCFRLQIPNPLYIFLASRYETLTGSSEARACGK